jgi:hypothetical protein
MRHDALANCERKFRASQGESYINRSTEMSEVNEAREKDDMTKEEWLQIRKQEALRIDPAVAEVHWCYGEIGDPYGLYPDLPECSVIGRVYFARNPGSDIWVSFYDLPDETIEKLRDKCEPSFRV